MLTERSRNKPPSANKLKRWTSIVQSASALAYRLRPLKLGSCQTLDQALETSETLFVCQPGGEEPRTQVLPASMTLLIGPEGGFSETELTKIGTDVRKLGLGPLNLRVETAAVVASSLLLNL